MVIWNIKLVILFPATCHPDYTYPGAFLQNVFPISISKLCKKLFKKYIEIYIQQK